LIFEGDFTTRVNLVRTKESVIQEAGPRNNSNYFIKRGARYVKFAVAAYGPNMLKILGIEKPRNRRFNLQDEHRNHYSLANHADIPVEYFSFN
jgi:predicted NACHT family NTPase